MGYEKKLIYVVEDILIQRHMQDFTECKDDNSYQLIVTCQAYGKPETSHKVTLRKSNGKGWTRAYACRVARRLLESHAIDLYNLGKY